MPAYCRCGNLADFEVTPPGENQAEELCGRCATLALAPHAPDCRVDCLQEDEEP